MPGMGCYLRQRTILQAPNPPAATTGLEGMRVADEVLKKYNAIGILIGGVAKEIWHGASDPAKFSEHKDVDVLILSRNCENHPGQWEAGIDWWVSHRVTEKPTNGTSVSLIWKISLEPKTLDHLNGLYICPVELLKRGINREKAVLGDEFIVRNGGFTEIQFREFPVMPVSSLRIRWGNIDDRAAEHCKRYHD